MVPPPDSTGDAFPDFDSMTPEEQMSWLESLAKRQGVTDEELTTAADQDIPIPENAVIDEPGYVPFSITGAPKQDKLRAKPEPPPVEMPEMVEPLAAEEPELLADISGGDDPMQWLGSLAIQSEEPVAEPEMVLESAPEPVDIPEVDPDDPLGGLDPMRWLESLAARQGASVDQFTTEADLDIEELPEDTVIDEPGYVPYDIMGGTSKPATRRPEPEPEPVEIESFAAETILDLPPLPELEIDLPPMVESEFDLLADAGPGFDVSPAAQPELEFAGEGLSWLEDLAGEPDEDVSDLLALGDDLLSDLETFVDEEVQAELPPVAAADADSLSDMTDEEIAYAQARGELTPAQELEWLTRQASKLAEVREEAPVVPVAPVELEIEEDLLSVVPGELPDWLRQMREESDGTGAVSEKPPAFEEIALPVGEDDIAGWLDDSAAEAEFNLSELELDAEADVESLWAETPETIGELDEEEAPASELEAFLQGDSVPEEPDQLAEALDAEYERRLMGDDAEPGWYTEAVERAAEEYDYEADAPVSARVVIKEPEEADEPTEEILAAAAPMDMPDWLRGVEETVGVPVEEEIPDWLREMDQELASADGVPAWLTEGLEAELPTDAGLEWLDVESEAGTIEELFASEQAPEPEPAPPVKAAVEPAPPPRPTAPPPLPPVSVSEPEIVLPEVTASIPEGELFEQYRHRLEADPNDYASRLALARALRTNRRLEPSLDHYEMLIGSAQLLQDVSADLVSLVEQQPDMPRVRRLLGDAFMRRGMLSQALEAYRGALEQL